MPPSPIPALVDQLASPDVEGDPCPQQVLAALGAVPVHGVDAEPATPLRASRANTICTVVSGAQSFSAMADWAADTATVLLAQIGVGAPNAATIRRTLTRMDAEAFDAALSRWMQTQTAPAVIGRGRQPGAPDEERWWGHRAPAGGSGPGVLGGARPSRGGGHD